MKGTVYKRVVRPVILFDFENMALIKRQEAQLEMLTFPLGVMRMDRIRNKHMRRTAEVRQFRQN